MARIFKDVLNDYMEDETGRIAIDAYRTGEDDPNGEGVVVAWVERSGRVVAGEHSDPSNLACDLVQEKILEAVLFQLDYDKIKTEHAKLAESNLKLISVLEGVLQSPDKIGEQALSHSIALKFPVAPIIKDKADAYAKILNVMQQAKDLHSKVKECATTSIE